MRVLHSATRAWHVDNATVYLQPELLAPPEQFEYHRALEFVAINPKHAGKKYRLQEQGIEKCWETILYISGLPMVLAFLQDT